MSPYPFKAGNCRRSCRQLKLLGISASCKLHVASWHYPLTVLIFITLTPTPTTSPQRTHQSLSICQQMTCIDATDESLKRVVGGGWRAKYLKVCNTRRALHDADVPMSQLFRQSSSLHSSTVHRGLWNRKSRRAGQKAELCTRKKIKVCKFIEIKQ